MAARATKDKPLFDSGRRRLPPSLWAVAAGRFVANVAFRLIFPFLPRIASGLGVSLSTLGTAIALRDLAGASSPLLGRGADRLGHSRAMIIALVGLSAGLLLQGLAGGLAMFAIALVIVTLAKTLFDVSSGAWIGEAVPFARRGRAIGLVETTWALSFVIAMPLAALAIRAGTWRTPFYLGSVLCGLLAVQLWGRLDSHDATSRAPRPVTWSRTIVASMAAMGLLGLGHQMLLVTFAAFLEDEHAVSVSGLGLVAALIGFSELFGSGAAAALSDRLGKARSVRSALVLAVPVSLLIPLGRQGLVGALVVIGVWFALSEFAIVSMLSLFTELDSRARGTAIGLGFAGWAAGNALGALTGARTFERHGMTVTAIAIGVAYAASATTAWLGISDPREEDAVTS
jgi:predicted MFS family arabinose efflux permease